MKRSTDIGGRIRKAIKENRRHELMYHVGRPGEDGYANRVLQAWGLDGHNSHTNVCSSSARLGHFLWTGADRPSPDHANARDDPAAVVAPRVRPLLQSARAADHRRQIARREAHRHRSAAVEHVGQSGHVAAGQTGHRGRAAPRDGEISRRDREVQPRVRPPLGELGDVPRGEPARAAQNVRGVRRRAEAGVRALHARSTPRSKRACPPQKIRRSGGRDRGSRHRVLDAQLARRGGRTSLGLADHALSVSPRRADGRDRRARRREPAPDEQVRPEAIRIRRRRPNTGTSCSSRRSFRSRSSR